MPTLPRLQLPSRKTLLFIGLSLLWYSCSFLSSSTSKALLSGNKVKAHLIDTGFTNGDAATAPATATAAATAPATVKLPPLFPYPVSLTALQFFFVFSFSYLLSSPAIAALIYKNILRKPAPRDAGSGRPSGLMSTLTLVNGARLKEMVGLSVFNVTGHAMTSAAIQMVPVSTVHTVKALSPLFTVLAYVFILNLSYSLRTYISLAPLTLGVIFACSGLSSIEGSKAWIGIALSVGSTVVFVAQNLWSKKLLGHALSGGAASSGRRASQGGAHDVKLDKINILFWSSGVSVVLMLPMLFYSDVPKLLAAARASRALRLAPELASLSLDEYTLAASDANHTTGGLGGFGSAAAAAAVAAGGPTQSWQILRLLVSNGVVHFSQNLLAFSVLGLTSPVTYSIASLFKRVFVICFAILWFGQTVTSVQWAGILLTFVGLYLYNDSKQRPTPASAADGIFTGKGSAKSRTSKSRDGFPVSPSRQSMAATEEEAAYHFGIDKGTRRATGILPTAGAGAGPGPDQLGFGSHQHPMMGHAGMPPGRDPSAGPIWKGMSSNSSLFGQGQPHAQASPENPYPNGVGVLHAHAHAHAHEQTNGVPPPHGHAPPAPANGWAGVHVNVNGHGAGRAYHPGAESKGKEGPKRD